LSQKTLVSFESKDLYSEITIQSDKIFAGEEYYILNIWASWCLPCRDEHLILMKLRNNSSIKLIGLNYKDDPNNAKKFIDELGNPYSMIITDKKGTIAIDLGAYGVPETFIINKNRKIIKKFIGSLNQKSLNEIKLILK
jgi:cytochrome c biogenesis protein CcmG/thiol:disulfide interchange protein DsbE